MECGRDPQADHCSTDHDTDHRFGLGENKRTQGRNQQQRGFDPTRSKAIEEQAQRELRSSKRQEVCSCQQPEVGGIQTQVSHQVGCGLFFTVFVFIMFVGLSVLA